MSSGYREHLTLFLSCQLLLISCLVLIPSSLCASSVIDYQTEKVSSLTARKTSVSFASTIVPPTTSSPLKCDIARMRCAYRMGCGMALQSYMITCAELIANESTNCPIECQNSLIALTSTDEGEELADCDCDGSSFCELSKQRLEVCRHEVLRATASDSIVSCQTARAICMADLPCSTALTYYYNRCQSLFSGGRCHPLCKNSLDILKRQEKASKLKTCYCEGSEDFECQIIKESTERLCLNNFLEPNQEDIDNYLTPYTSGASPSKTFSFFLSSLSFWGIFLPISATAVFSSGVVVSYGI